MKIFFFALWSKFVLFLDFFFPFDFTINLGQALPIPWVWSTTCQVSGLQKWRVFLHVCNLGRLRKGIYYKLKASLGDKARSCFKNPSSLAVVLSLQLYLSACFTVAECRINNGERLIHKWGRATLSRSQWKAYLCPFVPLLCDVNSTCETGCRLWNDTYVAGECVSQHSVVSAPCHCCGSCNMVTQILTPHTW